jgi:hypothetical protein
MSAGGISFDCLTTSRKVTLPSVEDWGSNMNILKDPPKSLYTKKKDRVGDNNRILIEQEDSGDRIQECINVYPRGINPMVSVNYNNYGNSQLTSSLKTSSHGGTILPYRSEVFRPPVLRQEDLVPLSRQPRDWFYATTSVSAPAVYDQMKCAPSKKAVRDTVNDTTAATQKTYIRHYPLVLNEDSEKKEIHTDVVQPATTTAVSKQHVANATDLIDKHDPKYIHQEKTFHTIAGMKKGTTTREGTTEKNVKPHLKHNIHQSHVKTAKGSSQQTKTVHSTRLRREGQNPRLYSTVAALPFYKIETPQAKVDTKKNIQDIRQLSDGVHMSKKSQRYAMSFNPDKIKVNPKLSTTMEINPAKPKFVHPHDNAIPLTLPIHDDPLHYSFLTPKQGQAEKSPFSQIDVSKIPVKNQVTSEAFTHKTGQEKHQWLGKGPTQRKRTVDIYDTNTVQTKMKPPISPYTVQETTRELTKQAHFGSFDPKPQSVSSANGHELNFSHSKQISNPKNRGAHAILQSRGTKY